MSFDETLGATLLASSSLTALVGNRIYHDHPSANPTAPFLTFHEIDGQPTPTHDTLGTDLVLKTYQFSAWALTPAAAKGIRSALAAVIGADYPSAVCGGVPGTIFDSASSLYHAPLDVEFGAPV